jgi:hypothetical protein
MKWLAIFREAGTKGKARMCVCVCVCVYIYGCNVLERLNKSGCVCTHIHTHIQVDLQRLATEEEKRNREQAASALRRAELAFDQRYVCVYAYVPHTL